MANAVCSFELAIMPICACLIRCSWQVAQGRLHSFRAALQRWIDAPGDLQLQLSLIALRMSIILEDSPAGGQGSVGLVTRCWYQVQRAVKAALGRPLYLPLAINDEVSPDYLPLRLVSFIV